HNWDLIVQKFRQLVFLHRVRDLNLVQKTVPLNIFLLPKLWFVASVCGARSMDIARVSSMVGTLLVLPRKQGGLNLHIPDISSKALFTN
uniref:Uncharacterized protein n=1 Tax=Anopheles dirus TaxID=7168 RepID=A0A182N2E2_9DIPT